MNIINIFFPLENENISTFNYDLKKIILSNYINNFASGAEDCNNKYLYPYIDTPSKVNSTEFIKCIINCSIYDISNLEIEISYLKYFMKIYDIDKMEEGDIKLILTIIRDSINNGIIDYLYDLIKNNTSILNYLLDILIESGKGESMNIYKFYDSLYYLFKIDGIENLLMSLFNTLKKNFLKLLGLIAKKYDKMNDLYNIFINNFEGYETDFLQLAFNILKNYKDTAAIIRIIGNFFKAHKEIFEKLKEVIFTPAMAYLFSALITTSDKYLLAVKELIFSKNDTETLSLFFSIAENDELFDLFGEILINIDNNTFLTNNIGKFCSGIVELNSSNVDLITNLIFELAIKVNKDSPLTSITLTQVQKHIANWFKDNDYKKYNISQDCLDLINYTYFDYQDQTKDIFLYYFQKFLLDSTRGKGNLLTFDNCLNEGNLSSTSDKYKIYPAYIIGIVNYSTQKSRTKNSSFYSKYDYIGSTCFPYGFKNKDDEEKEENSMCSRKDYNQIFKFTISLTDISDEPDVETIHLYQNNIKPEKWEDLYGILILIILLLPVIINIILVICKNVIISRQKTNIVINQLITDSEKRNNNKIGKKELIKNGENKKERKKNIIFPNWYLYLKECFDIFKN